MTGYESRSDDADEAFVDDADNALADTCPALSLRTDEGTWADRFEGTRRINDLAAELNIVIIE